MPPVPVMTDPMVMLPPSVLKVRLLDPRLMGSPKGSRAVSSPRWRVPALEVMVASAATVKGAMSVLSPEMFWMAPTPPLPVPESVMEVWLSSLMPPCRAKVPPELIVVAPPLPKASSADMASVPAEMMVSPA